MATTKVSELAAHTTTDGAEELLINDGGTSKKVTIANLLHDNSIDSDHYVDGSIDLAHMSSESVDEDNLHISNAGSNGQFLSKQSGDAGGLTWAAPTDTNTMGSGFTVSATTDSNATTITQGDDLMFTAGTGITCETTADGTVTITNTVSGASTATASATGVIKIEDDTDQSVAANAVSATAGRTYGVQLNSSDQAVVNVPWTDTDTTYTKASFDLDHLFTLVGAAADTDEHLSTFTGTTIADNQTIKQALQALETSVETKTSNTGDITGVDLTGGTGISIDSETNTASGSYSSTITCNLEGTELASTGVTGTTKFLRVDGDGTCSWQVPPDTNTTYAKADFDLDHLFTLVGASADTDEHLGTFTGDTISDNQTVKAAIQALETAVETKGVGDMTGVDLTGGTGISIDSETNTGSGAYSSTITCNLEGTELASTGVTGTTKFLRVDGDGTCSWQVPPDTDTTYAKADFDIDHLFTLVGASADTDENLGTFTGTTISDSRTIKQALQDLETELETKTTNTGDITGVDLTGGTGISIDSETNTGSGDYSSTITCNLEGTELASTGVTGTTKFLRVDGDGTCSWQVPPDTDTTYTKASFDLDHLFTLVGASADTDEHLSTFTGSTISDNQTIKQALQALETAVETKGTGTVDISGTPTAGHVAIWTDADTITFDNAGLFWDTSNDELGIGTATPGSTLDVRGSVQFKSYTVGDSGDGDWDGSSIHELHDATKGKNYYILCDTGNTNRTVELPDASAALVGRTYVIKKVDNGSGTVTIQPDDNDGTDGYLDGDNATVNDGTNILFMQYDTISCTCAEGDTDTEYEWHIVQEKVKPHSAAIYDEGTTQTLSTSATPIHFDEEWWAHGCTTVTGTDTDGAIAVNRDGNYLVKGQIFVDGVDEGQNVRIVLYKKVSGGSASQILATENSNNLKMYMNNRASDNAGNDMGVEIVAIVPLSKGDAILIGGKVSSGSGKTVLKADSQRPYLQVTEVSK